MQTLLKMSYSLDCFVLGSTSPFIPRSTNPFPVDIAETKKVGSLKEKNAHMLATVVEGNVTLYRAGIDDDETSCTKVNGYLRILIIRNERQSPTDW